MQPFSLDVLNSELNIVGTKYIEDTKHLQSGWFNRPRNSVLSVPLQGPIIVYANPPVLRVAKESIGYLSLKANDVQHNNLSFIMSTVCYHTGSSITPELFNKCMISLAVRRLIKPTWVNASDQYQVPTCDRENYPSNDTNLPPEFVNDCVVYALFNGANNTSCLDVEWKGEKVKIENNFYPFSPAEAAGWIKTNMALNTQARRADKSYVCNYLETHELSDEAKAVLEAGRKVYECYYANLPNLMQQKWHLEYWNPGWYQIRMALKDAGIGLAELENLKTCYKKLSEKLVPQVYSLGFLAPEMDVVQKE